MTSHSTIMPELTGAVRLLLQRAEQTSAAHRSDVDGWCAGCASDGHLMLHPCSYARWADGVRQQYADRGRPGV
jgi:hypothetical protein